MKLTSTQHRGLAITFLVTLALAAGLVSSAMHPGATEALAAQSSRTSGFPPVFTPAHQNPVEAIKDFFGVRPDPIQPIAFSHQVHLSEKVPCNMCHTSYAVGPQAGLPDIRICMSCHGMIASDRPEVKKVTAYAQRGEDIPWQRVYAFSQTAHLKFNHSPHIRAGVDCSKCHGELARQTVAQRAVKHTMGFCVDCHRANNAPTDCLTCHF